MQNLKAQSQKMFNFKQVDRKVPLHKTKNWIHVDYKD